MFNTTLKNELTARTADLATYKGLVGALERSMAVIEFSPDGKVLRANQNFLNTMGYREDQLAGLSHRNFCTSALVGSAEYREFWDRLRAGQFVSGTFQRISGQGRHVWLEASYNPVLDEQG
ncbi:MAG: PAS domain-containing protein, partial [Pseudomonas sp.]